MKRTLILISLFSLTIIYGQVTTGAVSLPTDLGLYNQVNSKSSSRALSYDEIKGTPYPNKQFVLAKFKDNFETAPARYNSFKDNIEYQKNNEIFILPDTEDFSRVTYVNTKETLVNLKTGDEFSGYFYELVNGENALYKKIKTKFTDAVLAKTTYDSDRPAFFKTFEPFYYIKTAKGFIKKPKNQKEILEQFPDKKEALSAFFKENKIKFDKEEDLKKLVTFLNQ
ncbi:hypothetical protein ACI513_10860 [Chryseobacterium sp. M5]|uniref:hypothetical protein n=1 Tax=Chryseobacterium TaxID=59732 RepID=UPI003857720F